MDMKIIFTISLIAAVCVSVSCSSNTVSNVPAGMTLVWADEFDTNGVPDKSKWDYSLGGNGWGNGEVQTYTKDEKNVFVKNGKLNITAIKDKELWTSTRIKTQYKAEWTYCYIEIRAKLPKGVGTWPAIWMLPSYDKYGNWPRSGEIDIMEHVGYDQNVIHTTVHTGAYNHRINTQKGYHSKIKSVSDRFIVYAVEWRPDYIQWYVDGKPYYRFDNEKKTVLEWPFDIPYYLIMNLAIGGSWGGKEGIDPNMKSVTMQIDYVRVYQ